MITSTDWWVSLVAQTIKNLPAMQEIQVPSLRWEDPLWRREWLHPLAFLGFPGGASSKEPTCQCRRHKRCWIDPWVGKIPWRRAWLTDSSIPAWRIQWTEEPDGLQSIWLQRVGHDLSDLADTHALIGSLPSD